ncbi:MAG: MarR family winged helix-turn-helix transcriptional regulator [Oscillospiraceae bacterium]|jgi:MarR family transcriptional regulator for hemolysin|nr:MarR family winged helix-turn-helix transcriptional regulator [Oscillospiraceae bacterium]
MIEYQFEENFLYYARMIKRLHEKRLADAAERLGLSFAEADVLCFLRENPLYDNARDIAAYRDVSRAYVSKAVESLSAKGMLEVSRDKADRRYYHLVITDKAMDVAETLHEAQQGFYETVTQGLTESELYTMLSLIGRCAVNVAREVKRGEGGSG